MTRLNWDRLNRWRRATRYQEYGFERDEHGQLGTVGTLLGRPERGQSQQADLPVARDEPPAHPRRSTSLIEENETLHRRQASSRRAKPGVLQGDGFARLKRKRSRKKR